MARAMRIAALGLLLGCGLAGPAAATLYRCGNAYQDRPCDANGTEQRVVPGGSGRAPAAAGGAAPGSPFAAACARVGEQAQRIVWKREGGATQEKQLAEAGGNADLQAIIQSVYMKRGTAPEIRAAIEAECITERQKQFDAAEMLKALQKQAGSQAPGASAPAAARTEAPASAPQATPVAVKPDPRCAAWRDQQKNVEMHLRSGGNAAIMESLQNQRREVEKKLSDARC